MNTGFARLVCLLAVLLTITEFGCRAAQLAEPNGSNRSDATARPTLIFFHATWCGPCQMAKPIVVKIEAAGIEVIRYDIDARPKMVKKYGVTSVPTFFIQCGGHVQRTQDIQIVLARLQPYMNQAATK